MEKLDEPLPETSSDPVSVLTQLNEIGSAAAVTQTAGRYFGFVNGGMLPVGLAAKWPGDVWDQNAAHWVMSPINSRLEEICERWIVSLLHLPQDTAAGFVSGTTIANFSGLCAGRNELLRRQGWDVGLTVCTRHRKSESSSELMRTQLSTNAFPCSAWARLAWKKLPLTTKAGCGWIRCRNSGRPRSLLPRLGR